MDYKVLYRKYRPSSFNTIVGQEYTIKMLQNAIIHNKISHAYLFTGPRGTGKTSTAKVFAKTINCENIIDGEACGKCSSCLNFAHSPDIIEIDAASNNGVDDIRELINNIKLAPSESKYKIYIIDEVHMMTQSAFNALLLTLEEPPAHAIFIMATTNVESVPITILSRCQRFNFEKISLENLKKQISFVCREEKIDIEEEAIEEIAYLSEGGLRDALSLLDQLSSDGDKITIAKILSNYGSISSYFIRNVIECLEKKNIQELLKAMNELENGACDYKIFIKKIIHELMTLAIKSKENPGITTLDYEAIKNLVFDLNRCMNEVSIHVNPFSLIKLTLLSYIKVDETIEKDKKIGNQKETSFKEKPKVEESVSNIEEKGKLVELKNDEILDQYLEELKKIRINNCLTSAKKELLNLYQSQLEEAIHDKKFKPDIIALLMDTKCVVAGPNIVMLSTTLASGATLINHKLEELKQEWIIVYNQKLDFVAVANEEWLNIKKEYIQNIKNGVKYEVIDESSLKKKKPLEDSQLKSLATELFGNDSVEVL